MSRGSDAIRVANRFAAALSFADKSPLVSLAMKNQVVRCIVAGSTLRVPNGYLARKRQKRVRRLTDKVWSQSLSVAKLHSFRGRAAIAGAR